MLTVIRKNQQVLMLAIAIMTIVAFIWLYNRTNISQLGSNDVFSIYGQPVQQAEVDRLARGYQLALALGLTDFVRDLGGMGQNEELSFNDFILNLLVTQHQAPELGIRPSDEAVVGVIRTLPPLQTKGVFDPAKYASFLQQQLSPRGYTERQMEEMIRDSLKVKAIRQLITSPVAVGEAQVREASRIYQPVTAQVLRFEREDFMKRATVTSDEVVAFYDKNKEGLRSRETRTLSYAVLELPAAMQKKSGAERTTALQKLADNAVTAVNRLREEVSKGVDFAKAAANAGLQTKKTGAVDRDGTLEGKDSGLPVPVVASAFRLQKTGEVSDIVQDGSAFYIVTVTGINPIRQLVLADVAEKITDAMKAEKAAKASAEAATATLDGIRAAMKSGKSFEDAARQAGVKPQFLTNVIPSDTKSNKEQQSLAASTLGLKAGELGQLQPAPWGSFAVYLEKRTPLTDVQWNAERANLTKTILDNEQSLLFAEWLRQSRGTAQLKMLGRRGGA